MMHLLLQVRKLLMKLLGRKRKMHLPLRRLRAQRRRNLRKTSLQRSQKKHRIKLMGQKSLLVQNLVKIQFQLMSRSA
jgi:hypothetical protein